MQRSICLDPRVEALGAAARRARRRAGPVIVAASAISTWFWCPRKAWLDNTLFNTGWLSDREAQRHRDALASLWKAQLLRSRKPSVKLGRRIHGEYVGAELEEYDECLLVEMGARGLIDPAEYEKQLEKLEKATDPVLYFREEEWPLFRYVGEGFEILGVPDEVTRGRNGYVIVELKTTRSPERFLNGPGYQGALHQLAAYYLTLSTRWPVEEAVLVVVDQRSRRTIREEHLNPEQLESLARESLEIAKKLASIKPPEPLSDNRRCRSCEYNTPPASCATMETLL